MKEKEVRDICIYIRGEARRSHLLLLNIYYTYICIYSLSFVRDEEEERNEIKWCMIERGRKTESGGV